MDQVSQIDLERVAREKEAKKQRILHESGQQAAAVSDHQADAVQAVDSLTDCGYQELVESLLLPSTSSGSSVPGPRAHCQIHWFMKLWEIHATTTRHRRKERTMRGGAIHESP